MLKECSLVGRRRRWRCSLGYPVLIYCLRKLNAGVAVVVKRVCQRMDVGVVVRCKLRFDIRNRDEAASERSTPEDRVVEVEIHHRQSRRRTRRSCSGAD